MSIFQLEPLHLKQLPDSVKVYDTPFNELSVPEASSAAVPKPGSVPKDGALDRVHELEQMLADSQGRAAEIEQEAYDKAYAAGEKAGMALGQKRAEQILERMQQMQQEAERQFSEIRHAAGETIIDMAGQLSAWLIGELTSEDQARLIAIAEKTAQGLPQPEETKIAISPADYADFEKLMEGSECAFPLIVEDDVPAGRVKVFNKSQDILVDPYAALADAITVLKSELLKESGTGVVEHGRP